jgi:hypothetical protein
VADVFISYSHEDSAVAERIDSEIRRDTALSVWRDVRVAVGTRFEGTIQEELRRARVCLVLMSRASLASEYCQNEVGFAEASGMPILPVRLDDCSPSGFLATRSYIDFSRSQGFAASDSCPHRLTDVLREAVAARMQNDLRRDYIEIYRYLLSRIGGERAMRVFAATVARPPQFAGRDPCAAKKQLVGRRTARKFCEDTIGFLERGGVCHDLLPVQTYIEYLPAWLFRGVDLDRKSGPRFSLLPDVILVCPAFFHDDAVIDASAVVPVARDSDTPSHREIQLPVDIEYRSVRLDLDCEDLHAFVLSKGIYRVGQVRGQHFFRLTLTNYLSIQSARLRLFTGNRDVDSCLPAADTLQLTYLRFSRDGSVELLLFNDQKGIAVVSSIDVVVHEVTPILTPTHWLTRCPGAPLREYRYTVKLKPAVGRVSVTSDQFKYGPGDVDHFKIDLGSDPHGYHYTFNIEVSWYDVRNGVMHILATPHETVAFPLYTD